jgi:hypothetical protein
MAQVKNPRGGIVPSDISKAAAVVMPAPDIESQLNQEHAAFEELEDEREGMGMGIALFVLILVGLVVLIISYIDTVSLLVDMVKAVDDDAYLEEVIYAASCVMILSLLFSVFLIAAIVIASVLTCGCCCASKYKLKFNVKKWSTATLVMLCLVIATNSIGRFATGELSSTGLGIFCVIQSVLLFWL